MYGSFVFNTHCLSSVTLLSGSFSSPKIWLWNWILDDVSDCPEPCNHFLFVSDIHKISLVGTCSFLCISWRKYCLCSPWWICIQGGCDKGSQGCQCSRVHNFNAAGLSFLKGCFCHPSIWYLLLYLPIISRETDRVMTHWLVNVVVYWVVDRGR